MIKNIYIKLGYRLETTRDEKGMKENGRERERRETNELERRKIERGTYKTNNGEKGDGEGVREMLESTPLILLLRSRGTLPSISTSKDDLSTQLMSFCGLLV